MRGDGVSFRLAAGTERVRMLSQNSIRRMIGDPASCYHSDMDQKSTRLRTAFFAGVGSAFALFPVASLQSTHAVESSAQTRIYQAFTRVGAAMNASMGKVADEQKKQAPRRRRA